MSKDTKLVWDSSVGGLVVKETSSLVGKGKGKSGLNPLAPTEGSNWLGDVIAASQAHDSKCNHVSADWVARGCTGWDTFFECLQRSAEFNKDVMVRWDQLSLEANGELRLVVDSDEDGIGGEYSFGANAKQWLFSTLGNGFSDRLLALPESSSDKELAAEEHTIINGLVQSRFDAQRDMLVKGKGQDKQILLRLRDDGESRSLRAVLSDRYAILDHRFIALCLYEMVGDQSYVSHFDADRFLSSGGDAINFNVLLHDEIIQDQQLVSEWGGMYFTKNNEVGAGGVFCNPALMKFICQNGQIWDAQKDKSHTYKKWHKGQIDYSEIKAELQSKLRNAIPLNELLVTYNQLASVECAESIIYQVLGHFAKSVLGLTAKQRKDWWAATDLEAQVGFSNSACDVVNVLTRYASHAKIDYSEQEQLQLTAGKLTTEWSSKPERFAALDVASSDFDIGKDVELVSDHKATIEVLAS